MKITNINNGPIGQDNIQEHQLEAASNNTLGSLRELMINSSKIVIIGVCALMFISSCDTPAEKVENAEKDVLEANKQLTDAQQEYAADIELFRIETDRIISENEREIREINRYIAENNDKVSKEYKKQIAELEQKKRDLKRKMGNYKSDSNENWQEFKAEFKRDLDEFRLAVKDLTSKN